MAERQTRPLSIAVAVMAIGCFAHVAPTPVAGFALTIATVVAGRLVVAQRRVEHRRRQATPTLLDGVTVYVEERGGACTAGPLRPIVLVGATTLALLTPAERRAVLLHEEAHRRRRDPLWAALWSLVPSVTGRARHLARREIRADATALASGAAPSALAAALLKLPASAAPDVGFTSPSEARVRALLDPDAQPERWSGVAGLVGATLGLVLCGTTGHALVMALL